MDVILSSVVVALTVWHVDGQTLPPPPQKFQPGPPVIPSASQVFPAPNFDSIEAYCDLRYPNVTRDPSIVAASMPMNTRSGFEGLLRDSPVALAYRNNLRAAHQARDATRSRASPQSDPPVNYLAPTARINICNTVSKSIFAVRNNGNMCYTFQEESVEYADCATSIADVPNAFPEISQWYCVPDSYRELTFMVICPNTPDLFRWHTVSVPLNCCGRRFICDFTPYQSLIGPRLF